MTFNIGGKEYYEPSAEAVALMVNEIQNMAQQWIGVQGKMPKFLVMNTEDFRDGEEVIVAALWQYSHSYKNMIEPLYDPKVPRGMMSMLAEEDYQHKDIVIKWLQEMKATPELVQNY